MHRGATVLFTISATFTSFAASTDCAPRLVLIRQPEGLSLQSPLGSTLIGAKLLHTWNPSPLVRDTYLFQHSSPRDQAAIIS